MTPSAPKSQSLPSLLRAGAALPLRMRQAAVGERLSGRPQTRSLAQATKVGLETGAQGEGREAVAAAALRLLDDEAAIGAFSERIERASPKLGTLAAAWDGSFGALFQDHATKALAAGAVGEAAWGFAILLQDEVLRSEALLGLAVCAVRRGADQDAGVLAMASRADGVGHPRAYYIQGFAALQSGNKRGAQAMLAAAARIARRDPAFVEDLRMAQQVLLLLQLQ